MTHHTPAHHGKCNIFPAYSGSEIVFLFSFPLKCIHSKETKETKEIVDFKVPTKEIVDIAVDINNERDKRKGSSTLAHIEGFVEGGPTEQTLQSPATSQHDLEEDEVFQIVREQ